VYQAAAAKAFGSNLTSDRTSGIGASETLDRQRKNACFAPIPAVRATATATPQRPLVSKKARKKRAQ